MSEATVNKTVPIQVKQFGIDSNEANQTVSNKRLLGWSLISTAFWMCLAHLPRWMNVAMASYDSLMIYQNDQIHEIAIGRFLQPVYVLLRGDIASPFVIGILASLFLGLAVFLICKLANLLSPLKVCILSGTLATCFPLALHNATYTFSFDLTMLAALFGVLAVFLTARYRFGFLPSIIFFAAILALSPGYITVSVTLSLVYLFLCALQKYPMKYIVLTGIKALVFIGLGALLYLVSYPVVQESLSIEPSTYRNFSSLSDSMAEISFVRLLWETYSLPFRIMANPPVFHGGLVGVVNLFLFFAFLVLYVNFIRKRKLAGVHLVLSVLLLLLLPLGMNCTYIIARQAYHELFYFSYNLSYVLPLFLINTSWLRKRFSQIKTTLTNCIKWIVAIGTLVSFVLIIAINVIYANQVYVKKDLEAHATFSVMTRIIDEIEELDGYEPGVTPVAFAGYLRDNPPYSSSIYGFSRFTGNGLENGPYSTVNYISYKTYTRYLLHVPLKLVPTQAEADQIAESPEAKAMPVFPHKGYCAFVDGVVVVKLSEGHDPAP